MIQDKKITIAAGAEVTVQGVGTFVGVLDVSDTTQELRVSATNEGGQTILSARILQGERVTLDRQFNQLRVKNEGAAEIDVLLLVGSGKFESGRLTGSVAVENEIYVKNLSGGGVTALDDLVIAAGESETVTENESRKELHIDTNADVRYGDGAAAGKGKVISAGVSAVLELSGAVYIYNDSATTATLTVSEVLK